MKTINRPVVLSLIATLLASLAGCAKSAEQTAPAPASTSASAAQVKPAPAEAAPAKIVTPAAPAAPAVVPAPAVAAEVTTAAVAEAEVKKTPSFAGIPAAAIGLAERTRLKAEQGTTGVNAMFSEVISKAQALLKDKRLPEALKALDVLDDLILTPEQQTKVDALKAQITQAMKLVK